MKINHNIQALNAYRNLYQNQVNTSKNLEKLSSGLRINRAADDAAGLAISEKMRSQIRGLDQAERNALDGISLMQTAEGAMDEVHSMLQRMRELSVQAANDTNTASDRQAIQLEIDQLSLEIDSVAAKTEFNTRKLLDGSSAADTQYLVDEMGKTNVKDVPKVLDPSLQTGRYEVEIIDNPELTYRLNQPGAGVSSAKVISIEIEAEFLVDEALETNIIQGPKVLNPAIDGEGLHRVMISDSTLVSYVNEGGAGFAYGSTSSFKIKDQASSELPLGEYTIEVTGYHDHIMENDGEGNVFPKYHPAQANIKVTAPDGSVMSTFTNEVVASGITIGSGNKQVTFGAGIISGNGTAKISVEAEANVKVEKLKDDGTSYAVVSENTSIRSKDGVFSTSDFEFSVAPNLTNGISKFEVEPNNLELGEYTIVVSDYETDENNRKSATIEVFDPNGFSIGQLASRIGEESDQSLVTIGPPDKQVQIDTSLITQAGTAKVQIENKIMVSVAKVETDENGASTGNLTPITFQKELTTSNGVLQHGGLELEYGVNARRGTSQFDLTNKALSFQIGANTNQTVFIDVPELSTVKLGIDGISVLDAEKANDAIFKLEKAITEISSVRSKLGATQNRLEHTINNLQVTSENLTSAESRIRDTDMAEEMTEFTKNNILNQSAQAMLSQANQLPQGILQLLQR